MFTKSTLFRNLLMRSCPMKEDGGISMLQKEIVLGTTILHFLIVTEKSMASLIFRKKYMDIK